MSSPGSPAPMEASPRGAELFRMIADLDGHFRNLGARLPEDRPFVPTWAGVLFRLRDHLLLAPLDQVLEVLELPAAITPIPGTRSCVMGVANNRGTLLPIFDLAVLVDTGTASQHPNDRVLVVRQAAIPCGLLVSEAIGIRHLETASRLEGTPAGLGMLAPFVDLVFPVDGISVPVLALDRLLAGPLLQVAEI